MVDMVNRPPHYLVGGIEAIDVIKSRFIVGCGVIINGQPKLMPMVLKENGRWNGHVS